MHESAPRVRRLRAQDRSPLRGLAGVRYAPAMESIPPATPPWQWAEAQWRRIVNHVRAGRTLRPRAWKGGARCAVALSFDSDHETNELRDGGKSIGRLAWGQYGSRVGVPRIRRILREHDVCATFFVFVVSAMFYPEE